MRETNVPFAMPALRLALAALPVGLAVACTLGASETTGSGVDDPNALDAPYALRLTAVGEYAINGDTPTVAWSPDGKRLAVADQISYYAETPPADPNHRTISVIDTATTEATPDGGARPAIQKVHDGFGYHPVWLDDTRLSFGVSTYESDDAIGIWTLDLNGRGALRRVSDVSAYHTRRGAEDGSVLYWAGWPAEGGWRSLDIATGASVPVTGGGPSSSWQPPAGAFIDQCPTTAGSREVGLWINGGYVFDGENDSSAKEMFASMWTRGEGDASTPIQPCLSPDGQFAVFFVDNGETKTLQLMRVEKVALDPTVEAAKAEYVEQANASALEVLSGPDALPGDARGDFDCYAAEAAATRVFRFTAGDAMVYGFEVFWAEPSEELDRPAPFTVHLFDASGLLIGEGNSSRGYRDDIEWTLPDALGVC